MRDTHKNGAKGSIGFAASRAGDRAMSRSGLMEWSREADGDRSIRAREFGTDLFSPKVVSLFSRFNDIYADRLQNRFSWMKINLSRI